VVQIVKNRTMYFDR